MKLPKTLCGLEQKTSGGRREDRIREDPCFWYRLPTLINHPGIPKKDYAFIRTRRNSWHSPAGMDFSFLEESGVFAYRQGSPPECIKCGKKNTTNEVCLV
ncbi:hypothetical protein AVEN_93962-1 [Araneus ventricosus]|uniref:Uncharacterized protein n=1 Tax=Araneus ventricosus TaxID=182803 RepID=A0A4Y2CJF5_ARAVE|nr:hypothetical protein AVEN_93962-1 [Araneus ventricosus]